MTSAIIETLRGGDGVNLLVNLDYLVWAKDGQQCKAIWGACRIHKLDDLLGFSSKTTGSNWVLQIGKGKDSFFIMGEIVHYAQRCDVMPTNTKVIHIVDDEPAPIDFSLFHASGEKMLLTTRHWYHGLDGNQYSAVFGTAKVIKAKDILSFDPKNSANWLYEISGETNNPLYIMGCQVQCVQLCANGMISTNNFIHVISK